MAHPAQDSPSSPTAGGTRSFADAVERWRHAGRKIRIGCDPDEPRHIDRYLQLAHELHRQHGLPCWDLHVRCAGLLLNTADDRALPMHWRCLCVDALHKPLAILAEHAGSEARRRHLSQLRWRMARLDLDPAHSLHARALSSPWPDE
ncbi:MAG: hypothetical protein QM661_03270 [Solimonas sp.]